jgi:putative serine protease PepD
VVLLAGGGAVGLAIGQSLDDEAAATTTVPVAVEPTNAATAANASPVSDQSATGAAPADVSAADVHGTIDVYAVLQNISDSIVTISSTVTDAGLSGESVGTGVIVTADGQILTNNHVVEGATQVRVRFAGDTEPTPATVVAVNAANDLALLQVDVDRDLQPVTFADPATIRVGDQVMAIGYALDLDGDPSVTTGIVSATNRTMPADNGDALDGLVQTDAAISSGNSGGPLVNTRGEVVGINTAVITSGDGVAANNVGFAIGSAEVQRILAQLQTGAPVEEGYLGITPQERTDGGQGAVVVEVAPSSPAALAGVEIGDVIVAVGEIPVDGQAGVVAAIRDHAPGDQVQIIVVRNGEQRTLTVTLVARPVTPSN